MNFIQVNRLERYKGSLIEEALLHIYTSHKRDPKAQNPDSQLIHGSLIGLALTNVFNINILSSSSLYSCLVYA